MTTKSDLKKRKEQLEDNISYLEAERKKYITDELLDKIRKANKELEEVKQALKKKKSKKK